MSEAQARARHQQRIEELCAASIRALSGERDLHFRGGRLHRGRRALPLYAPHLHPSWGADDFRAFRGAADGLALRLAHSDAVLHQRVAPGNAVERVVFELLEQFRCEALAPAAMPGVRHNLRHAFEAWSLAFHHAGLTDSARGIVLYTVAQMSGARVTGEPVVEATEDFIESTRFALGPKLGVALAGLRRELADQAAYALHAIGISQTVAALLHSADEEATDAQTDAEDTDEHAWAAFSLLIDHGDEIDASVVTAVSGRSGVLEASEAGYRVFTSAHDREVNAATLVRKEQLAEYREQLDRRISAAGINLAHLARDLKSLLAVPVRDGWDGAQEEGHIDGRRLAQLIATPTERRLFRTERRGPVADCIVSVLIDCSGSMKEHIESVAVFVDVLVRAPEQAGVASELLGYTTNTWNGGRAQRDWVRAGRPAHPGRLNEACHLVSKDADTPWRHARPAIAALLRADLFREGIDGEAVDWAMRRLKARSEERRLLIVVSDGSPMDSATNLANDAHYLDHHLKDVVARHEQAGAAVIGVGVGLDLSPYYRRSHVLDLSKAVTMAVFRGVIGMIARQRSA
ncbi:MAG: cobalt chelatase [Rhizobacter sp.]|nr:cobalt chelatase [Rhizobacter sp.]